MIVTCRASSSTSRRIASHALQARRSLNTTASTSERLQQAASRTHSHSSGSGSGSGSSSTSSKRRRYLPIVGLSALAMTLSTASYASSSNHEHDNKSRSRQSLTSTNPSTGNDDEMHSTPRDLLPTPAIQSIPTSVLIRTYLVYTLCSIPLLIDYAPSLLHSFTHSPIPGVKAITEAIVRRTFFAQFVPGESVEECLPTMRDLRKNGIGAVLNYSAEVNVEDGGLTDEKRRLFEEKRLKEVEKALIESGRFETQIGEQGLRKGSTSFALKVTGLVDPDVLHRASNTLLRLRPLTQSNSASSPLATPQIPVPYPGTPLSSDATIVARDLITASDPAKLLSLKGEMPDMGLLESDEGLRKGDLEELGALWGKLRSLGKVAQDNGVKLMIDAEHTWYQPALDAFTLLLSEEFNRPPKDSSDWKGPLIFGTYQSYLTRQPQHLLAAIKHAEEKDYVLGIKLVRGAYFVQERQKWKDEGRPGADPIWPDKPSTDMAYDNSIATILSTLSHQLNSTEPHKALSVVFGTHNPESCDLVISNLVKYSLAAPVSGNGHQEGEGASKLLQLRDDVVGKVFVAQLYGMKDDLTDKMSESFKPNGMPVALKYIAYGSLGEVLPFLGRRAIENKSVMSGEGGAAAERKRITTELWRRWFGW